MEEKHTTEHVTCDGCLKEFHETEVEFCGNADDGQFVFCNGCLGK